MLRCIRGGLHKADLSLVIDELLELSKSDSKLAFDIFDAFVNSPAESALRTYAYEKLSVPILSRVICSGDEECIEQARKCMDVFGAAGMTNLDVDVDEFLEGASAAD